MHFWCLGPQFLSMCVGLGMLLAPPCASVPAGYAGFNGWGEGGYLSPHSGSGDAAELAGGSGDVSGMRGAESSTADFPFSAILPRPLPFVAIGSADAEPTDGGWESTVRTPTTSARPDPGPSFPDLGTSEEEVVPSGVMDQVRLLNVAVFWSVFFFLTSMLFYARAFIPRLLILS